MSTLRAMNELDEQINKYQRKNDGKAPGVIIVHPDLRMDITLMRDRFLVDRGVFSTYRGIPVKIGDFLQPNQFILGTKHTIGGGIDG